MARSLPEPSKARKARSSPGARLALKGVRSGASAPAGARRRSGGSQPRTVPSRWVKMAAGVLLLPVCWVFSRTFFKEFTRATLAHEFWRTEAFYFFALGALLWLIAFAGLPRPVLLYVFGHELTHALWVWIQGGEVHAFQVRRDGGYIIADRRDFVVSLAPYFFPIYAIALILVYGAVGLWYPQIWLYRRWLFALLGAAWCFHLTFTCWMIPKKQTDLLLHGTFFSLVVIYLANLIVLTILLVSACPQVTWAGFGRELLFNAAEVAAAARHLAGVR